MALEIDTEFSPMQGFRVSAYVSPKNSKYESHYFVSRLMIGYTVTEAKRLLLDEIHAFYGVKRIHTY